VISFGKKLQTGNFRFIGFCDGAWSHETKFFLCIRHLNWELNSLFQPKRINLSMLKLIFLWVYVCLHISHRNVCCWK
jgi:hypothetical protein